MQHNCPIAFSVSEHFGHLRPSGTRQRPTSYTSLAMALQLLDVPLSVTGEMLEMVQEYKYLGVHLDWTRNSRGSLQEGPESALFSAGAGTSVVASRMFYAVVCRGRSQRVANTNGLSKLIQN